MSCRSQGCATFSRSGNTLDSEKVSSLVPPLAPPSLTSSPSIYLYRGMGMMLGSGRSYLQSTDRKGYYLRALAAVEQHQASSLRDDTYPSRSRRVVKRSSKPHLVGIHSGRTPLLYGRHRIRDVRC